MSLSTSKSKTQLAYTRSGKAITKPKIKNVTLNQTNEPTKSKHPSRNSTDNIYDSIMGQIESTQQDYIKSLIVKNQRQSVKHQRQSIKQNGKNALPLNEYKKSAQNTSAKGCKIPESAKKVPLQSYQRNKSQAQLHRQIINDNQSMDSLRTEQQRQNTQISCGRESETKQFPAKPNKEIVRNNELARDKDNMRKDVRDYPPEKVSPILQAPNNSSSSFAKKIQTFQLQYPTQQRQQRSTHKKVVPKLNGNYFSCQPSPKNMGKGSYVKEVAITTKPQASYKYQKPSSSLSPISSITSSNLKTSQKGHQGNVPVNFLSCLDQYLQALTQKTTQFQEEDIKPQKVNMKRNRSSKFKQISSSSMQYPPFTLGHQQQQEQTVVLQTNAGHKSGKLYQRDQNRLTLTQQQRLIRSFQKQRKNVAQLKSIIQLFNQKLTRYKKKQSRMKGDQYHMIECIKALNEQLTEEKRQKRRLEQVVREFQLKIRGISRSKDKQIKQYFQEDERLQRKTIYGTPSAGNSIHYNQVASNLYNQEQRFKFTHDKATPNKLNKHSKKPSMNRLSSMINNVTQDYAPSFLNQDMLHQNNYPSNRPVGREDFNRNRTQKVSNVISSSELDNHLLDQEEQIYLRQNGVRNSISNPRLLPKSCKNTYLNCSMPNHFNKDKKSRPKTPNIIQELFNRNKSLKNTQSQQYHTMVSNYQSDSGQDDLQNIDFQSQDYQREFDYGQRQSSQSQSQFCRNLNSQECSEEQQPRNRGYHKKENDMLVRMR